MQQGLTPERKDTGDTAGTGSGSGVSRVFLEVINYLLSPELIDGQLEVRTIDGTERRDIIFTNDSDESFWE